MNRTKATTTNLGLLNTRYLKLSGSIAEITTRSHTDLTDIGTLTHATIDSYLDQSVKVASSPTFAGVTVGDHGTASTDIVVNVCYGVGDPPEASTTTEGALFIKYSA